MKAHGARRLAAILRGRRSAGIGHRRADLAHAGRAHRLTSHRFVDLDERARLDAPGEPLGASDMVVAGCFFVAREIKVSAALTSHVTLAKLGSRPTSEGDLLVWKTSSTWGSVLANMGLPLPS